MREYLKRAEAYAEEQGDYKEFVHLYVGFRASHDIEESVWRTIFQLYGKEPANWLRDK